MNPEQLSYQHMEGPEHYGPWNMPLEAAIDRGMAAPQLREMLRGLIESRMGAVREFQHAPFYPGRYVPHFHPGHLHIPQAAAYYHEMLGLPYHPFNAYMPPMHVAGGRLFDIQRQISRLPASYTLGNGRIREFRPGYTYVDATPDSRNSRYAQRAREIYEDLTASPVVYSGRPPAHARRYMTMAEAFQRDMDAGRISDPREELYRVSELRSLNKWRVRADTQRAASDEQNNVVSQNVLKEVTIPLDNTADFARFLTLEIPKEYATVRTSGGGPDTFIRFHPNKASNFESRHYFDMLRSAGVAFDLAPRSVTSTGQLVVRFSKPGTFKLEGETVVVGDGIAKAEPRVLPRIQRDNWPTVG